MYPNFWGHLFKTNDNIIMRRYINCVKYGLAISVKASFGQNTGKILEFVSQQTRKY